MMKITKILLSLTACMLAFPGTTIAQDDDTHGLMTVRVTTVKPGHDREYRELQGQLAASRKAAGHSGVTVYRVIRGPLSTYYSVRATATHAENDASFDSGMSEGDWQRWVVRITDLIDHSRLTTLRTHGELLIPAEPGSAPNMVSLRFTTLKAGTGGAHHDWLKSALLPALNGGDHKGFNVSNVIMGDDVSTWVTATRIDSWGQLDGPGQFAHMSESDRQSLFAEYAERAQSARVELLRFIPELSY